MVAHFNRPNFDHDYGNGSDKFGRHSFFRYFRPAGMPQEIRYPYTANGGTAGTSEFTSYTYLTQSGTDQRFLMPVLIPAGQSSDNGTVPAITPDRSNNVLHAYQQAATPDTQGGEATAPNIATMAAMPYDWDPKSNSGSGGLS